MSEKIFLLKPNYLDEFKCDGSRCNALCCRSDWNIFVDAATYEKYSALPDAEKILQHLRRDSEKFCIVPEKNCCPFLGEDKLCRLQKAHGEDYLSQVCASYPRLITRFENFLEVAMSPTCPVAAELIFRREQFSFEIVEASEKFLRLGESHILKCIPHDFAPLIFDVQLAMASILQTRRLTIDQRLIVLGFFLDRIEELIQSGGLNGLSLQRLSTIYASEKFLAEDVPLILSSVRFNAAAHEKFIREVFADLEINFIDIGDARLPAEFELPAENFLVNEIFLNVWPWRIDASIVQNFGVFAAAYKVFERLAISSGIMAAADKLSHKINHSDDCLPKISARLEGVDLFNVIELLINSSSKP